MNLEQIAYNIKFFRDQNGWTQEQLANKLMVSRSVVTKWENNSATPDIVSLIKLSDIFQVSIDHLVGNPTFQHELLKDFKRIYSSKTKDFDEEVVELIEYLMTFPELKSQLYRLKQLSIKKQMSIQTLLTHLIDHYEQL